MNHLYRVEQIVPHHELLLNLAMGLYNTRRCISRKWYTYAWGNKKGPHLPTQFEMKTYIYIYIYSELISIHLHSLRWNMFQVCCIYPMCVVHPFLMGTAYIPDECAIYSRWVCNACRHTRMHATLIWIVLTLMWNVSHTHGVYATLICNSAY